MAHQPWGGNIHFTVYDLTGDEDGRGLGTAETRLTLDHAFHVTNVTNLHMV
ncbi:hypothetical protein [Streptomyces sp. NPDC059134]|uniref:hypothetical protein n=1 Tax=Streptomyces sp. NPDC059134 TaxID=3346738 RepID=UPI0036A2442F